MSARMLGDVQAPVDEWPDPISLDRQAAQAEPYPLDALPGTIREAVEEVRDFVQAPASMVASCAMSAVSIAVQLHYDVMRAEMLQGPSSLFMLTVAESGERKTTCDGFFMGEIKAYQRAQNERFAPEIDAYRASMDVWESRRAGLKSKISQLAKAGKPSDAQEDAIRALEAARPEAPRVPRMLYADATPEALAYSLATAWPSGAVVSSEAGIVFGAHGMGKDSVTRNLSFLNVAWDGGSITIDRRTSESFTVEGVRLTMSLQAQEDTIRTFIEQSKGLARGTGFLARFLIAWPESKQGTRLFVEAPTSWPALGRFNQRIASILGEPVAMDEKAGALRPAMLRLSPDAKAKWIAYHDEVERQLADGGAFCDVRDVASKSADNAVRIAALFHVFEGHHGNIGADTFIRASRIAAWHLNESRRFLGDAALSPEMADAVTLDKWLVEYCRREGTGVVGKNHTRQYGPLRNGGRLDAALAELSDLDRVRVMKDAARLTIRVNPALIGGGQSALDTDAAATDPKAGRESVAGMARIAVAECQTQKIDGAIL